MCIRDRNYARLVPSGVERFLEIHELEHGKEVGGKGNELCESSLGVVGCDRSVLIVSTKFLNIIHKFKGHDNKVVGLYLLDKEDMLFIVTKTPTIYIYSISSGILERRVKAQTAFDLLDLDERLINCIPKHLPTYTRLFEMHTDRRAVLKQGCNRILDFYHSMETLQVDWKQPFGNKAGMYRMVYNGVIQRTGIEEVQSKESLVKVFNHVTNLAGKVNGKYEADIEVGFMTIQALSLIHICRCRRYAVCRSRWSPYH
eukprot:TRINITY_DN196_c0_g1_i17.p1 TRINITY_DN196_c0_g1~~TRINITY_DN196_c0_g1_i17.p1  ORF type:complete len:257 (-),score=77.66 TRINITY_DN196_c0_g1_i17:27-797(-)